MPLNNPPDLAPLLARLAQLESANQAPDLIQGNWSFLNTFSTPVAAPLTTLQGEIGRFVVTDTAATAYVGDGVLYFGTATASNDPGLWTETPLTRLAGRAFMTTITIPNGYTGRAFGVATGTGLTNGTIRSGIWLVDKEIRVRDNISQVLDLGAYEYGDRLDCMFVFRASGFFVFIRNVGELLYRLLWISDTDATASMYAGFATMSAPTGVTGQAFDNIYPVDFQGSPFDTPYGLATSHLVSATAGSTFTTEDDTTIDWTFTYNTSSTFRGQVRRSDATHAFEVRADGTNITLHKVNGTAAQVATAALALTNGNTYRVRARVIGNIYQVYVGTTQYIDYTDGTNFNLTATLASVEAVSGGVSHAVAWPYRVLFPMYASPPKYFNVALALSLTSPTAYQTIQRNGSNQANIAITGTISTGIHNVEARWNGGSWTTIATNAAGTFSGSLANQAAGQGTLEVRLADNTAIVASASYVGIGDVYIVAGQSNAVGQGTSNQAYSHATLRAALFGNNYTWSELTDPTDRNTGQVDTVSRDTALGGSIWPLLATQVMADQSVPVAFVPCAKGSTEIALWQPATDHQDRTTLYGSMVYRALQTGCKAVLWWQGERDANLGTSQATYNASLDTLANSIQTDLGVKLVAYKFQNCTAVTDAAENVIRAAITQAVGDNTNVLEGPDLSDLSSDDGYHLMTTAKLQTAADRSWTALETAFY